MTATPEESREDEILLHAIARLNGRILGLVLGILCGSALFLATLVLVLKGGPDAGAHLWLLVHYFYGYSVTVPGAFVGFLYGFLLGYLAGYAVGKIYNRVVSFRTS